MAQERQVGNEGRCPVCGSSVAAANAKADNSNKRFSTLTITYEPCGCKRNGTKATPGPGKTAINRFVSNRLQNNDSSR